MNLTSSLIGFALAPIGTLSRPSSQMSLSPPCDGASGAYGTNWNEVNSLKNTFPGSRLTSSFALAPISTSPFPSSQTASSNNITFAASCRDRSRPRCGFATNPWASSRETAGIEEAGAARTAVRPTESRRSKARLRIVFEFLVVSSMASNVFHKGQGPRCGVLLRKLRRRSAGRLTQPNETERNPILNRDSFCKAYEGQLKCRQEFGSKWPQELSSGGCCGVSYWSGSWNEMSPEHDE